MNSGIQVVEKPDWVSWDEIKQCLVDAHATNRERGINMSHAQWSAEKIRDSIGANGVVLVALDGRKVVGTAVLREKEGQIWYASGRYAYMCFASVLPQYRGLGIYRELVCRREEIANLRGYPVLLIDTNEKNTRLRNIAKMQGYHEVDYRFWNDHFNVVMAKCPNGSHYSKYYCKFRYILSRIREYLRHIIK